MSVLVSVLVRSLDRPFLQEALASVAAQTHPAIEVVVVAVRPGHAPLPTHCGPHPLRLLPADAPRPRSLAANVALDAAHGQYLLFLDDDDWLMPGHIARLVQVLQTHPQAQAAYAGVALVDLQGRPMGQVFDLPFDAVRQLSGNLTPIHAVLFSAALRDQGCRFDEALDRYEDWDFWIQVARHTVPVHVDGVSAVYRIHDSSGVHDDAGAASASSRRVQHKWLQQSSPQQLGELMQRVWSQAELAQRLSSAEAALSQSAVAQANGTAALAHSAEALAHSEQTLADQTRIVTEQTALITALRADLQQQLQSAAERHAHERAEAERHRSLQADLRRQLADQTHRADSLQLQVNAFLSSTSWRITAPLRRVVAWWTARSRG